MFVYIYTIHIKYMVYSIVWYGSDGINTVPWDPYPKTESDTDSAPIIPAASCCGGDGSGANDGTIAGTRTGGGGVTSSGNIHLTKSIINIGL